MKPLTGLPVDSYVKVSQEADIPLKDLLELVQQVENGASAAFLARYRADLCAGLDEERVHGLLRSLRDCRDLVDRRISMLTKLSLRGALTPELKNQIEKAANRRELNDVFMPYRPRERDEADAAIEKGLDPLARALWFQREGVEIEAEALKHVDSDIGVEDAEQALSGAYAIAARWLSEKPEILRELRKLCRKTCELSVTLSPAGRKDPRSQALDGYRHKAADVPWQKRLAIRRGVRTGRLATTVEIPPGTVSRYLERCLIKDPESSYAPHLSQVVSAAIRGGLSERAKRDALAQLDEKADSQAIASFRRALRGSLLAPTAHGKRIVGIETGRQGGWRAALIDGDGKLVDHAIVQQDTAQGRRNATPSDAASREPSSSTPDAAAKGGSPTQGDPSDADSTQQKTAEAGAPAGMAKPSPRRMDLSDFLRDRDVDLIVYPAGPRPHSVERLIRSQIRRSGKGDIAWHVVRDSRTWIYATSKAAKRELPQLDPASRSAVSLARRVQDPMAELVKSDPKTVGIGPNHQEVNAARLREVLRQTVERAVHDVGVDANRAPVQLLALVPGFTERLAKRIVAYRKRKGPYRTRADLRNVDGLSDRIFAQAVGFLRVHGDEPLDLTGAHPQYNELHQSIADAAGCDLATLLDEPERLDAIDPERFATKDRSVLFVKAAIEEFKPRRRHLRDRFEMPKPVVPLRTDEELKPGSKVGGVVSNISDYGAWVDIGGDQDALLHVSQIHKEHLKDSKPAFRAGDAVDVYIRPPHDGNGRVSVTMWQPRSRPTRAKGGAFRPRPPRTFDGPRNRRRGPGRSQRRKPFKRTFGPDSGRRARRGRPRGKLTMTEKLNLLQDKYRTKV